MLDELGQDPADALGMDEGDRHAVQPDARLRVDELHAFGTRVGERLPDVRHGVGDVMQAGSSIGQELAHHRVPASGRYELELRTSHVEKRGVDPELLIGGSMGDAHAKARGVERDRLLEVLDDDADVVELHRSYLYQPSPVLRPSLPAFTFASSCGEGRYRSSPVVRYMCRRALYVTSRPLKSPSRKGPIGQLRPFSTAVSMSSNDAT